MDDRNRINLTIPDAVGLLLAELAELTGKSKTEVVHQLIIESLPVLEARIKIMRPYRDKLKVVNKRK